MMTRNVLAALVVLLACRLGDAAVVINEVFYNAPDDLDDLEWIELHNTSGQAIDLAGYRFARGTRFTFPPGARIEPNGYLVLARNLERFKHHYPGVDAVGPLQTPLSDGGETIELLDAAGKSVDQVKYNDRAPYPASADGQTASLERICPTAPGDTPANWAPSPLGQTVLKPSGTPGKPNAAYAKLLPPAISKVSLSPADPAPAQPLVVQASVTSAADLADVTLLYRVIAPNKPGPELSLPMSRDPATGRHSAAIPPQEANRIVRYRIKATDRNGATRLYPHPNDLRPTLSAYVHETLTPGNIHLGYIINVGTISTDPGAAATTRPVRRGSIWGAIFGRPQPSGPETAHSFGPPNDALPPQGPSAFVFVDQKTAKATLFDHINITDRSGGYKLRFHKDQPLNGMTTVNLVLEQNERFVLAEHLSYELYRRAGVPCPLTSFVRLHVDDRLLGYHLLIEQPNSAFLRRNKIATGGNLYKLIWWGRGVVGQHEKKSNRHTGHDDIVSAIERLQSARGDEQWKLIRDEFDADEFISFYAVNMVISDWDGFFNNFFAYHDPRPGGKWIIFPWDRDKTWGWHDGIWGDQIFTDMPLTFGMTGDRAPAGGRGGPWGGAAWWRPAGYFSGPMLANPEFRSRFLSRTREILEKTYTPDVFFPVIDELKRMLEQEVRLRAQANGGNPEQAADQLERNVRSLKQHLAQRREFLLGQAELKAPAGPRQGN